MEANLCFAFELDYEWFDFESEGYKNKLELFYAKSSGLQKAEFFLAPSKQRIVRPFHFEAADLANEYPGLGDSLAPLDAALKDLFKVHAEFDKFVRGLDKKRSQTKKANATQASYTGIMPRPCSK